MVFKEDGMAKKCYNYDSQQYEEIDEYGFSYDQGEYVNNWDDSPYHKEQDGSTPSIQSTEPKSKHEEETHLFTKVLKGIIGSTPMGLGIIAGIMAASSRTDKAKVSNEETDASIVSDPQVEISVENDDANITNPGNIENLNDLDEEQFSALEKELISLDESKLPEVIAKRMDDLAEVNKLYEDALEKKRKAQSKVDQAYEEAEKLVDKAAGLGQLKPKTHHFFKKEWSTKKDRIAALEECVKELGEFGVDTADFQLVIAKTSSAMLESQQALAAVQAKQTEYFKNVLDTMKFLYGLSAYGIASTESIVTNLQKVLSGAKKKELGEMAKQQMYLVMDQLKSQENIQVRLDRSDDKIQYIENALLFHTEKEEEINKRIADGEERDKQQDESIERQIKKDIEHDEAIAAGVKKDEEQDKQIEEQILKDEEHDRLFDEIKEKNVEQDQLIERLSDSIKELESEIESLRRGQMSRGMGYLIISMSAVAIILGVLHFFI